VKPLKLNKHYTRIAKKLKLKAKPRLLLGDEASSYIKKHKKDEKPQNGGYLFWTNTVAIINKKRIGTLAHEMRHAYQYEHRMRKGYEFSRDTKAINNRCDEIIYLASRKERDANWYALRYLIFNTLAYKQIIEYIYKVLEGYICLLLAPFIKKIKY